MRYGIAIEKLDSNYSAFVLDLPENGCDRAWQNDLTQQATPK